MNSIAVFGFHSQHDSVIYYTSQYLQTDSLNQELWRNRAQSKFRLKDTVGAIYDYLNCISSDTTNMKPILELARLYRDIEDYARSRELCELVLKTDENFRLQALELMGSTHIIENQIESAIKLYEEIVGLKPEAHYLRTLGLLFFSIEDFEKSLSCLKRVKEAKDFKKGMYPELDNFINQCEEKLVY